MTDHEDLSQTERELREALVDRARQIHPSSSLDVILSEASAPDSGSGRSRWLAGVGVAAAAAIVAGTVWAARPDSPRTLPVGPPTSSSIPSGIPSASASSTPTPSTSPTISPSPSSSSATTPPTTTALGIYRVGPNGGASDRLGLVREFYSASIPTLEAARVKSAVVQALGRTDLWRGSELIDFDITQNAITLRLSGADADAPDVDSARLAAYALVWTAQGAVGRGDLPVSLLPADGGRLLGQLDSSQPLTRAGTPLDALCDIWIDEPAPGLTQPRSKPVVVRGQAVAFEANIEWELRTDAARVRDGVVTASIGAPSRGAFSVDLGRLDAGNYTFRAFTSSAVDGSTMAERLVTFRVQ